jgi:hypothetical protein
MGNWKSLLKTGQLDWLLEGINLSVRCFTLTDILDTPADIPEVKDAMIEIMKTGAAPNVLAK